MCVCVHVHVHVYVCACVCFDTQCALHRCRVLCHQFAFGSKTDDADDDIRRRMTKDALH